MSPAEHVPSLETSVTTRDQLRSAAESALACGTFDGEVMGAVAPLLDQLTRAEAQSEVRRLDLTYWRERAQEFEARIKAVQDVLDNPIHLADWDEPLVPAETIRRALEGDA